MTGLATGPVGSAWLALREPVDARSRSYRLAAAASALVGSGPDAVVHDLGSGTGAFVRWLAPQLEAPAQWVLHDRDPDLLAEALARPPLEPSGRPRRLRAHAGELLDLRPDDLADASLVTASALLDLLTRDEAHHLVDLLAAVRTPALLSLTVTGRVRLSPRDPTDRLLRAAFNAHQRRRVDGHRLLGPDAVEVVTTAARERGMSVVARRTPWVLGPGDSALLAAWFEGWVDAATEASDALAPTFALARARREAQQRDLALRARVDHVDLLVRPR